MKLLDRKEGGEKIPAASNTMLPGRCGKIKWYCEILFR